MYSSVTGRGFYVLCRGLLAAAVVLWPGVVWGAGYDQWQIEIDLVVPALKPAIAE